MKKLRTICTAMTLLFVLTLSVSADDGHVSTGNPTPGHVSTGLASDVPCDPAISSNCSSTQTQTTQTETTETNPLDAALSTFMDALTWLLF